MRYDKTSLPVPSEEPCERLTLSRLRERGNLSLIHMRRDGDRLVCAEGIEAEADFGAVCTALFVTEDKIYGYDAATKCLLGLKTNTRTAGISACPRVLIPHYDKSGEKRLYIVQETKTGDLGTSGYAEAGPYGGYGVLHRERLFLLSGNRLFFSRPLSFERFTDSGRDPDGFGYIDFSVPFGESRGIAVLKDRLYLFFRRGILRMRADGEVIGFSAEVLPFGGGEIVENSVACTGERIIFFTDRGMWSHDGSSFQKIEAEGIEEIGSFVGAEGYCGKYVATVGTQEGGRAVFLYENGTESAHFVELDGLTGAAAGYGIFLLAGRKVYRLTEKGLPLDGECTLRLGIRTYRRLKGVRVIGNGTFTVSVAQKKVTVKAGSIARFAALPEAGEIKITVSSAQEDFFIEAIDCLWEEEDDG